MTPPHEHTHHHDAGMADLIDLHAAVSTRYLTEITQWVHGATNGRAIRRVLDAGTGTGAGAIALAAVFPGSEVVAADISPPMLHRVTARVADAGLQSRISTAQLDLGRTASFPEKFDLAWTSSSLHEIQDPDRALQNLFDALAPGGILAVVEMDAAPTYLSDAVGGGLETRIGHTLAQARLGHPDHPDWSRNLADTGFELIERKQFVTDEYPAGGGPAGLLAHAYLSRIAHHIGAQLTPADRATLEPLLAEEGNDSLLHRGDLHLRGTRTAWLTRRP